MAVTHMKGVGEQDPVTCYLLNMDHVASVNSQQPWSPAQALQKIKPVKSPACMWEGI